MRLATWNVNSVRSRLDALLGWLQASAPDIAVLQELKVQDSEYPWPELAASGYQMAIVGQKTYNGVAIFAKQPITVLHTGLDDGVDDPQARLIDAMVGDTRIISVYVPNGGEPGSDKYAYKLQWLQRLHLYLQRHCRPDERLCIGGDWNIAPDDLDVRNPAAWRDTVLCTREVRAAWRLLCEWGLTDAVRQVFPDDRLYSWWDYRNLGLQKNDGLRIDHWLVTAAVAEQITDAGVDKALRHGDKPSDHAPVWIRW